ncbi:MAG TPA: hypothetical protein PLS49_05580 [Candidatus Woesebacteria bacterium]|nr:hypothetical protein [Candidatus Woesebacteria bacterium]
MKILRQKKPLIPLLIIIILLIVGVGISIWYFFQSATSHDSKNINGMVPTPTQNPLEILKIEENINNTIEEAVTNYIHKTYPDAEEVTLQTEIVGRGYGIINATFLINEAQTQRKIYLKETNSNWSVIEESEDQISCETVQALNDPKSILLSFCR